MSKNKSSLPDLSSLLEPIPGKIPCGEFLRYTEVYDKIREARREDDETLPQGVWKREIKKADWERVSQLCQEALHTRSKDLQIAAWLTEAWLYLDGMSGLTQGLDLILGLTRTYWNDLHPQIVKDSYDLRILPYEWINTRLSEECQFVPISLPPERSALPYRFLDYNEASRIELMLKKNRSQSLNQPAGENKQPSLAKVSLSIDQTPSAFYRYVDESCALALKIIAELEEELRVHLNGDAPTFYRIREKVEAIQRFVQHILDQRGEKTKVPKAEPKEPAPAPSHKRADSKSIESREQAYLILSEVATYLEQIEPHSPTPYLIRRAIAWGEMTLSQVFSDLVNDDRDLSLLLDILNVKKEK